MNSHVPCIYWRYFCPIILKLEVLFFLFFGPLIFRLEDWTKKPRVNLQESVLGEEPSGGMNMMKSLEKTGDVSPWENQEDLQRLLRQVIYIQLQVFALEKATAWHKFGENCNLNTDLVLSEGCSVEKHFPDCDLDIECLVASPYLNHHQMRYTD